jgi:thymidylate synthase
MDYIISNENAQNLIQIMNRLAEIEVKGNSVEYLFTSRILLKQVIESLREIKKDNEENKNIQDVKQENKKIEGE